MNIVNFKIIPTDTIVNGITGFKTKVESNINPSYKQTGYGTTNLLVNLGLIFLLVLAVVVLIGLVFLLRLIAKKVAL